MTSPEDYNCVWQQLSYLNNCPETVSGSFIAEYNNLISLEGCSKNIGGTLNVRYNRLQTLKGCPEVVGENLNCNFNLLTSFEHFPKRINGDCLISCNNFTSFKGIDQHIEYIGGILFFNGLRYSMDITSGYLDLFGIDGLQKIESNRYAEILRIVNKYIYNKDLINFQDEMIKSGYESFL